MFAEVNDYEYRLRNLNKFSKDLLLNTKDNEWENSKYFLASCLDFKDFQILHEHYRCAAATRIHIITNNEISKDKQLEYLTRADNAKALLMKIGHIDSKKLEQYNKLPT